MFRFSLRHVGVYRHAQSLRDFTGPPMIVLLVSGVTYRRAIWPDGRQEVWRQPSPRFCIDPEGLRTDFDANSRRENWCVQLHTDDIRYNARLHRMELRDGGDWFAFPHWVPVPADRLLMWRRRLEQLGEIWTSPVPRDRLWARLTVMDIVRYMLEQQPGSEPQSPAQRLKQLIDDDVECRSKLSDLSEACGLSATHLRVLFERQYALSPVAYRNQKRMQRVLSFVGQSNLSAKQIARATGFKHVSHLSAAFRQAMGMTLTQAIARHRQAGS
jgi:AraC-like DNA-binding protein